MSRLNPLTRRCVLTAIATAPASALLHAQENNPDATLLMLCREIDALMTQLDQAIDTGAEFDDEVLRRFGWAEAAIVAAEAKTMEELAAKARIACWARLGDVDPIGEPTTDRRMALSMVRDLIRLCAPEQERPGALEALVAEVERGAGSRQDRGQDRV